MDKGYIFVYCVTPHLMHRGKLNLFFENVKGMNLYITYRD